MYVHDLNLFVTVQLLAETPAVLSLGKLCEDHGFSFEWVSGQKPRLTKEEKKILCKTDNFVHLVFSWLSTSFGSSSSVNIDIAGFVFNKSQLKSEVTNWHHESGADHPQKPKTKIKRGMAVEIRTTVSEIFLSGWRSS